MDFTTKIPIPKLNLPINYDSKIISFGSCFASAMGEKLGYYKFQGNTNPFGVLFHPLAIESIIDFALSERPYTEKDIFFHNERWHCFDVHSDLSRPEKEILLQQLNKTTVDTRKNLKEATHCIITLGTAWAYRLKETNQWVANCHKVPQNKFDKKLISVETIIRSLKSIIENIYKVNQNAVVIFTISPVRHLKDGFVENQISKAHLIAALHQLLNVGHLSHIYYFPSYEIVMDELRDYRFYAEDMIHPSQTAIDYIWQRFTETCIAENAISVMRSVENIQKDLAHKPFNTKSKAHRLFLEKCRQKINTLQEQHPHIQF